MKLIFHIGTHKTGTSFIQRYLNLNKSKLMSSGILYPTSIISGDNHGDFANSFKSSDEKLSLKMLLDLKNEIDTSKCDTVLISSECFLENKIIPSNLSVRLSKVFCNKDYDVSFIAFIRPQFDWFTSLYNEIIRDPYRRFTGTVETCREFELKYYDYDKLFEPWNKEFQKVDTLLYSLDHNIEIELLKNYLLLTDEDISSLSKVDERVNTTLKPPYLHFLRKVNQVPMSIDQYIQLVNFLNKLSNNDENYYGDLLSECFYNLLSDKLKNSNNKIPITYRKKINSYQYDKEVEDSIIIHIPDKIKTMLVRNASLIGIQIDSSLCIPDVHQDEYQRISNVKDRQSIEISKFYKFKFKDLIVSDNIKLINRYIIEQRVAIRLNRNTRNHFNFLFKFLHILTGKFYG
ncbi:hypothetical protein [Vibrio viridaestus]|uniref:Sulfotransferase domain-containing protein n=1 Tax=Vibrio viridaestus TaxID=2487322 RepID=A0A3N9TC30_9VIBR|nr:hypothetical protein [Vibrio viridaestus]RQW61711.1 hypothetical protein EES38_17775 [Vibrio viridaestus]